MKKIIIIATATAMLSGCGTMDKKTEFALTGCASGAVLGAGIGYLTGGTKGAIIGGAGGCVAGGAVGYKVAEHTIKYQNAQEAYTKELTYISGETGKLKKYNADLKSRIVGFNDEITKIQQSQLDEFSKQAELNKLKEPLIAEKKDAEAQVVRLSQDISKSESVLAKFKKGTSAAEKKKWVAAIEGEKLQRDTLKTYVAEISSANDKVGA